jgi:4-hydroxy-2-oxoglutarate aldolase
VAFTAIVRQRVLILQVADASPIPLLIYSYPAVSSGINMDTDLLMDLAKHPNIYGAKHTDHDVGKMTREASAEAKASYGCEYL